MEIAEEVIMIDKKQQLERFFGLIFGENFETYIEITNGKINVSKYFSTRDIDKIYDHINIKLENEAFFGVCGRKEDLDSDRSKTDNVEYAKCLWMDIDCHDKNKNREERLEIAKCQLNEIKKELNNHQIKPSIIVESGNGYHVYFILLRPCCDINEIKQIIGALANMAKSDSQVKSPHTALRIPTTINKKREFDGEIETKIIEMDEDVKFDSNDFNEIVKEYGIKKECFDNPLGHHQELGFVPPCIKYLFENNIDDGFRNLARVVGSTFCYKEGYKLEDAINLLGHIEDENKKKVLDDIKGVYESLKDGREYSVGCGEGSRLRHLIDNNQSICDRKQCGFFKKQIIESSTEYNEVIEEINKEYCYIENQNRIYREYYDKNDEEIKIQALTLEGFENIFSNDVIPTRDINKKIKRINKGKYWLSHKDRRTFRDLTFIPKDKIEDDYNLWKGFKIEPKEGDCSKFLSHLENIVCNGNEEHYNYLINWMAHIIQKPYKKTDVALVIRGEKGSGKSIICEYFYRIFREKNTVSFGDPSCWNNSFNMYSQKILLCSDEAFVCKFDKKIDSIVKNLITANRVVIKEKYQPERTETNYLNLMFISNEEEIVKASLIERRYFCLEVSSNRCGDGEYFNNLYDEMEKGGDSALLNHLMNIELKVNLRCVPQTDELINQKIHSLEDVEEFVYESLLCWYSSGEQKIEIPKEKFYNNYINFCKSKGMRKYRSSISFGMRFVPLVGSNSSGKIENEWGIQVSGHKFDIESAIKIFEGKLGMRFNKLH